MSSISRVAIMGMGIVAPGATGAESFSAMLREGKGGILPVERFDTEGLRAHTAGLLREFRARDFISPMKMRRMNNLSRYAVSATRLALDDQAAASGGPPADHTGVAIGTTFGPVETSVEYMREYVEKGAALAPPQLFAESVANAPGSHIAIEHGFTGFNLTFTQRESSALSAVAFAAAQIVKGSAAAAIAGGVEEINEMTFSVLDRIGALAHRRGELDECPRPFDRDRNGMGVGEGAAMFRLMRDENVVEPRWGYLSGFAIARDPSASISDWGSGADHVVRAMRGALDDAGVELGEIDAIWASANGTRRGDRLEATAIDRLFAGMEIPPVVATKGYFGEYAAAGALHLASALVALREQRLFASLGFRHPDAGARFAPTTRDEQRSLRHLLINSLSAGGGIVSAVLSRP